MIFSFLLGFLSCLVCIAWLLYRYVLVEPASSEEDRRWRLEFFRRQRDVAEEHDAKVDGQDAPKVGPEVAFLNKMGALYFAELRSNDDFKAAFSHKLEKLFNEDRPSLLNPISVLRYDLGQDMLRITSDIHTRTSDSHALEARFNVGWRGVASISLATSIAMPFQKVLPFTATVSFRRIEGRGALRMPHGVNPVCSLGFCEPPLVEVHVETDLGGIGSISNLPAVGNYLEKKAAEAISEELLLTRGGGFVLHLPIPYVRKGLFVTASKKRAMLLRGDNLEVKLRTPTKGKKVQFAGVEATASVTASSSAGAASQAAPSNVGATEKAREDDSLTSRFTRFTGDAGKGLLSLFETTAETAVAAAVARADARAEQKEQQQAALPPVPSRHGNSSYIVSESDNSHASSNGNSQNAELEHCDGSTDAGERKRDKLKRIASNMVYKTTSN